jgi:hypothetical protein
MTTAKRFSKPVERVGIAVAYPLYEANICPRYEIEKAAWIWRPEKKSGEFAVLRFENVFRLDKRVETVIHVSADQRYLLSLDGQEISYGPDRCDVDHRKFASYKVRLTAGEHRLTALVWWVGPAAPFQQRYYRGGFILAAEGVLASQLNTGGTGWTVQDLTGAWSFDDHPDEVGVDSRMVGYYQTIDGRRWFEPSAKPVKPVVIYGPLERSEWYSVRPGWKLEPSSLPDQFQQVVSPGRIIAVIDGGLDSNHPFEAKSLQHHDISKWQNLLAGRKPVTVPPRTVVSVLWDLDEYYCAYSQAVLSGGAGSELSLTWAEAFHQNPARRWDKHKGLRTEIVGKYYRGLRDTFLNDGKKDRSYRSCWWRSGRYILLTVKTDSEPLTINSVSIRETRYPLENEGSFQTDDPSLEPIAAFALRGIQMCSHETFIDCPHYEQGQYVGDTRLQMLITYALTRDTRLVKSGIEWFDWSRVYFGFTNSAYPSGPQVISTFPLYWVLMVHDYAWWRDDPEFIKQVLVGVRANLEEFQRLRDPEGLFNPAPGWAFVDTVPEWIGTLYGPDPKKGPSSIINLLYVYALEKAAELEAAFGEKELAARNQRIAREVATVVNKRFWVKRRSLFSDDVKHSAWSEHAQIMAILAGILPAKTEQACFKALVTAPDLARTQENFWMSYLFDTFHKHGRGDLVLAKLGIWNDLIKQGLKTPREMFEPSRSDCHGWGSHPLFHFQATLAGIRPIAPGFTQVKIAPAPGHLKRIESRLPHPHGFVEATLEFSKKSACRAMVVLPDDVTGVFQWNGHSRKLTPGKQLLSM